MLSAEKKKEKKNVISIFYATELERAIELNKILKTEE